MVVTVTVGALGKVTEAMVVQLTQEGTVAIMAKVLDQRLALLQPLGHENLEASSVRHPRNPVLKSLITQHVVHLLRERHIINLRRVGIVKLRWNLAKVTVGMIHVGFRLLDDLDHAGFHGILVFHTAS